MDLDEIAYDKDQGVAVITLNRPAQLNPISARVGGTRDQVEWALADAASDSSIGAVMLRGAGKAFSGGGDLTGNARRETALEQNQFMEQAERFHRAVRSSPLPVVAAVHGYCLGAAVNLIACCDIVIAAEGATFGVPEGRIGLIGASPLVPLVGRQWAKFLILTGELIPAAKAREIGLVLSVEPDDEIMDRVSDLCQRMARLPREAAQLNKRTIDAIADASGDAAGRLAGAALDAVTLTNSPRATAPDGRTFREIIDSEGMQGMKQARAAQYTESWLR
ncbi:MAG: putative enoyl-CoA hydratase/carnitine racemase match [Acidimicrobiia bacterium]|nr:putative enoyl-CoA hydratase/carnitine racemase match [Acidimicrobiia bacterium]